ncbi:MAG: right-handed parallel beta-helix repeat-containing protein [Myxococcales bacterium]
MELPHRTEERAAPASPVAKARRPQHTIGRIAARGRAFLLLVACACGSVPTGTPEGSGATQDPSSPVSYVDAANGRDTNDGRTPRSAYRTLQRAARELRPGWTIKVMSGTYTTDGSTEPLLVDVSGTPDAWITVTAAEGQHPVIQIPEGPGAWSGIHLLGASYVIIDGFEVVGRGASITKARAVAESGPTKPLYNHNCIYVDGVGSADVHPKVPHDIVIRNSILRNCTSAGIEVNAGDAITILHNKVANNSWWTVFDTSGIGLYHLTDAPGATVKNGYKNFIVGNEVWGNRNEMPCAACKPVAVYDGNGIIIDDSRHTQDALGANDVVGVRYTGRTYIANNIVHDNGGRGIHVYRSEHVDVVNNTTWNNILTTSEFLDWGEVDGFDSTDVQFLNNVSVNLVGKDLTFDEGNRYDFNVWEGGKAPRHGPNDVLGAAHLTDPANGNFAPAPGSPAIGSGTATLAPADDFFGTPRPAGAIDRGAVQVSR